MVQTDGRLGSNLGRHLKNVELPVNAVSRTFPESR
jgi:hypothetical protein